MPPSSVGMSRSWAWPVVGLAICVAGCARQDTSEADLVARSERAVAELERLRPRLSKAGTPDAEGLAERLGAVRDGLAALPAAVAAAEPPPPPPQPAAAVRCPDDGCWRLGCQFEAGMWQLRMRGGGEQTRDNGPVALGLAMGLERARPLDHRLEWSWGGEAVVSVQDRSQGQQVVLVGVRPFVRGALALSDRFALTARPLVEFGQASVRLGADPGGVLDRADVYAALGLRAGWRWRLADGDLTGEVGWREIWFNASAGPLAYRIDISSPEVAIGWSGRF